MSHRFPGSVFVGRERECSELFSGLDGVFAGSGRMFLVAGEPGIGKTALAEQVAAAAGRRGANSLWGRCWEGEGAPPYWPWVQMIREWVRDASAAQVRTHLGAGAGHIAAIVAEVRTLIPNLEPPAQQSPEEARFHLFDAIISFLRSAAREKPLVLVLDDIHWADRSSLLLLRFLAREMSDSAILLLATYRDVEVTRGHPLSDLLPSLRHERVASRILLRGLSEADVRAMLAALLGEEIPDPFVRAVAVETEGNPFFVEELSRHLVDEGILARDEENLVGRFGKGELPIPESLREIIGRRLERLDEPCQRVLATAATIGKEFSLEILARVSGLERRSVFDSIDLAERAGVIREVPHTVGRWSFSHALVRETIYQALRPLERVELHRRIGETLEELYAADPVPHLVELAYHFLETLSAGESERGIDYTLRAARQAKKQVAYEMAVELFRRALDALEFQQPRNERGRCECLLELGEAIQDESGRADAGEVFLEAARSAERLGASDLLARAALGAAGSFSDFEVYASGTQIELLEKALDALDDRESAMRAKVMGQLSAALTFSDQTDRKVALARESLAMARRVGDKRALAHILYIGQIPSWSPDNLEERLANAHEMSRLADEIGESRLATQARWILIAHLLEKGDIEAVRKATVKPRVAHEAFGKAISCVTDAMLALLDGRFEEVELLAQRSLEFDQSSDSTAILNSYNALILFLRREQDRLGEIVDMTRAFLDQYPRILAWRGGLVWAYAELGREEEARRELERFTVDGFRGVPREMLWLVTMWHLAEVAVRLADRRRSEMLYELLLPYKDRCVTVGPAICAGSVARVLGSLATVLSRFEEAQTHFEQGLVIDGRLESRPWVAYGQFEYARLLTERGGPGDSERAKDLSQRAYATARTLGMKALERKLVSVMSRVDLEQPSRGEETEPLRASSSEVGAGVSSPSRIAGLCREGGGWTIRWEGQTLRFRHSKGFVYLAYLLARPGEEMAAIDLMEACEETSPPSGHEDFRVSRDRLSALREELSEAERLRDRGRVERARARIETLVERVGARRKGASAERARLGVTKPLRLAIRKIVETDAALGRHLTSSVRTGYVCVYDPGPDPPVWEIIGREDDPATS